MPTSPPPVVRPMRTEDLDPVAALFDAYRTFYEQPSDVERATHYLAERTGSGDSTVLVAEVDGELVGFTQLYPTWCSVETAPILVLYDLFVAGHARGRGVGRALLEAAAEEGRSRGVCRLELATARTNLTAQRLYESAGWERDEVFLGYSLPLG